MLGCVWGTPQGREGLLDLCYFELCNRLRGHSVNYKACAWWSQLINLGYIDYGLQGFGITPNHMLEP